LINAVTSEGQDIRPLHRMTVDFLRAALLMKSGVKDSLELSKEAYTELSFAATNTSMEHLLRALRLFGQVSLKFDQPSPLPLELATVELSLSPQMPVVQQTVAIASAPVTAALAPQPAAPPNPSQQSSYSPQQGQQQQGERSPQAPVAPIPIDPNAPVEERLIAAWPAILRALSRVPRRRFDVAALLRSSTKRQIVGAELFVRFTHTSNSERLQDELEDPRCRLEVERILEQVLGTKYTIKIETDIKRNTANLNADNPGHLVRAAMSLGGQVIQHATPGAPPPTPQIDEPFTKAPPPAEEPLVNEAPLVVDEAPGVLEPVTAVIEELLAQSAPPVIDDAPVVPAIKEPITNEAPLVVDEAAVTPSAEEPAVEPQITDESGYGAPTMARNLFNEMQKIPLPPLENDASEREPEPAAAARNNQIPADYDPGPDEEELNV
jgi:DNA polymerase III gamma/tau subunit